MSKQDTDWQKIKSEYLTSSISYRDLAKKHNVPFRTLSDRAIREGWCNTRNVTRNKTVAKAVTKAIKKTSDIQANIFANELKAAELITCIVLKALRDNEQFNKHLITKKEGYGEGVSKQWVEEKEFSVVDAKRLKDIAAALSAGEAIKRRIEGVLLAAEKEKLSLDRDKLKLDEERLNIDRAKAHLDGDDEVSGAGVVILPDIDNSLTDNAIVEETKYIITKQEEEDETGN